MMAEYRTPGETHCNIQGYSNYLELKSPYSKAMVTPFLVSCFWSVFATEVHSWIPIYAHFNGICWEQQWGSTFWSFIQQMCTGEFKGKQQLHL